MVLCRKIDLNNVDIKIVDSLMGTGKTSWAIQYMNDAPFYKKFIYITPFKTEVERVIKATKHHFVQPETKKNGTKLSNLRTLIAKGENIVSTHALFRRLDDDLIDLIKLQGYTLILDEVMNVLENTNISKADLGLLLTSKNAMGEPTITIDDNSFVQWNDKDYKEGRFLNIKQLAEAGNLMLYKDVAMYWLFPVKAFKGFDEVFVLTYMFDGQMQRYYYDLFELNYTYHSVEKSGERYQLIDYIPLTKEDRVHLKDLINIYYSTYKDRTNLNKIGEGRNALSSTSLSKLVENREKKKILKCNAYNFYRNKIQAPTNKVMWTTRKEHETVLSPIGLKKQFVSATARATNDYADKSVCIYLLNVFMNPIDKQFFERNGVKVNEDLFALSELLQWIFRSRVRKGEPIDVYIPSERMRKLLCRYLGIEVK
ncbi:DEAD/DEAH box helicase family protein [Bacillus manliponensis]|uniref:DEAD/DEAH box helicase family protein n=1 Tax=Bacillus manliponensis TaxID=574376 RepID=UPI0035112455